MSEFTAIKTNKINPSGLIVKIFFLFVLMAFALPAVSDEGKVVLIAAKGSNIEVMSIRDIRRLYLGLKTKDNNSLSNPIINLQSVDLYDEFLKNIMRMTDSSYKRKQVKAIFRQGREEILEVTSLKEINSHLLKNKGDVTFVEISSIESMENIEVVQILW